MRRFFISSLLAPEMVITGDDVRHIGRVLRMQPGDKCVAVATDGRSAVAKIKTITANEVVLELETIIIEDKEPIIRVVLVQGLPKSDKMDYIVQKAVELGISSIIPLAADRSVVQYHGAKAIARIERWQKIAAEAAKQCRRSRIPQIANIQKISEILPSFDDDAEIIMLYEGQTISALRTVLTDLKAQTVVLLIGPEGGFSNEEVILATQHGASIVTMGPRILRTETAAIAAVSAVMYACGDLGG
ncbi:Ribosomal RNA small subunit methyltransferase E [bioreactor metagenome]|uniref:16S rRNA (uracil(1498)-N(3))-methyltransferase n=1 Tax=bioreactor metagenome TaxID=1076179 RepID=A0A644T8S3_9ZZZZ